MKIAKWSAALLAGIAVGLPTVSSAQMELNFAKPEDAIEYRQGAFQVMRGIFGSLQPIIRGQVAYNKDAVAQDVKMLQIAATLPWAGFVPDSQGGDAKANVWTDRAGFDEARDNLIESLKPLAKAADEGDLKALRAAYAKAGASCKACHDQFRN